MASVHTLFLMLNLLCLLNKIVCLHKHVKGLGNWRFINVSECHYSEFYLIQMELERQEVNMTHDQFKLELILPDALDCSYGLSIMVYKFRNGIYKLHHTLKEKCLCAYLQDFYYDEYAKAAKLAGFRPLCPIPMGEHLVDEYLINYNALPDECYFGKYRAQIAVVLDGRRVFCTIFELECKRKKRIY